MHMQKPQKLYRLYSLIDDHHEVGNACLEWIYHLRDEPVLPYDQLIKDYHKLDRAQKEQGIARVDHMFTEQEVVALSTHLEQTHGIESFLEERTIPISIEYLLSKETPEITSGRWGSLYMFSREGSYKLPFEVWAWVHPRSDVLNLGEVISKGQATISILARQIFTILPKIVTGLHFYILDCGCIRYQRRFMDGTLVANVNTYRDPEEGLCRKCGSMSDNWKARVIDEKVVYDFKVEIDMEAKA